MWLGGLTAVALIIRVIANSTETANGTPVATAAPIAMATPAPKTDTHASNLAATGSCCGCATEGN